MLLHADDSALLISGKNISEIEMGISRELDNIHEWLVDNRLSLHLGKTEAILFGPKRKVLSNTLSVHCKGIPIECKECVTYLGAELDWQLSGENMANKILKKS